MSAGLLLVLEGGEGVGKTTQWQRLREALSAVVPDVVALREPGGTPPGDAIRALLLDAGGLLAPSTEALLFAASRAELIAREVRPALARGAVVLLDRYLLSTYVYQGHGRGLPVDTLRAINAFATGGLVPDATLLLQLPLDTALERVAARGAGDRMEREAAAFHVRVAGGFAAAVTPAWQARHPECGPIVGVPADGDPDAVTARCLRVLATRFPARFGALSNTPV